MFKVQLKLVSLVTDLHLQIPLSIRIKKEHWHFNIIDKINSPVLNVERSFDLKEQQGIDSTFQIQLISKIAEKKAKMIGSVTIDVKEYPMETQKADRVKLGSHAWLQFDIKYSYVPSKSEESLFESSQLQNLERAEILLEINQKNTWLHSQIQRLRKLTSQMEQKQKHLQEEKVKRQQIRTEKERQFYSKQIKIQQQHQKLTSHLNKTNYSLTSMVNLVYDHGDMQVINNLNDILSQSKIVRNTSIKESKKSENNSFK